MRLALLGLVALVVPTAIIGVAVWCVCRRWRYTRRVKNLRLHGARRPGQVDDEDLGNAVKGGDWLDLDTATRGMPGIGANHSCFSISAPLTIAGGCADDIFDPIGQQAAEARQRKRVRRVTLAAEAAGSPTSRGRSGGLATPLGDDCGAAELEMWSSDEEGDDNPSSVNGHIGGGSGRGAGNSAEIFATTLVLSGTGASGAGVSSGVSPSLSGTAVANPMITVVPQLARNPQYFNETARVLLDRYTTEGEGGGPPMTPSGVIGGSDGGPPSLRPAMSNAVGGSKAALEKPKTAFAEILSSTAAPLQPGMAFHQRVDNASSGSAGEPKALTAPAARGREAGESHIEEGVFEAEGSAEEEQAFYDDEEVDATYKEEEEGDDDRSLPRFSSGAGAPSAEYATHSAAARSLC
ncbi:hypothetical protein LSCM1_02913 [Leishmania martiniquensis]|uniref:3'a2rel-related protein n=1 Tax=Leishmania martiniquensis TaxID=1580590 RepID=A0A836GS18_9TRYP|nr:hypothetical protein LSCM1_02913 [Leishmania martiniquensis]